MDALNDSQECVVGKEREEPRRGGEWQSLHRFQRFHPIPTRLILGFVLVFLLVQPIHASTFVWSNGTTQILGNGANSDVILTPTGSGKVLLGALCVKNQTISTEKGDLVLLGRENLILDSAGGEVKLAAGKWLNLTEGFVSFADGAVCTSTLCDSGVDTNKLQDGAITEPKLGSESVSARCLVPGSVGPIQLANESIITEKLADGAIIASKISGGAVGADMLANDSVTTPKVADKSITAEKIDVSQVQQRVRESCTQQGIQRIHEDGSVTCLSSANPTFIRSFNVSSGERIVAGMAVVISAVSGTVSPGVGVGRLVSIVNLSHDIINGIGAVVGIGGEIEIILYPDSSTYPVEWSLSAMRWPIGSDAIWAGAAFSLVVETSADYWLVSSPGLLELSLTEFAVFYTYRKAAASNYDTKLVARVCEISPAVLSVSCGSQSVVREHSESAVIPSIVLKTPTSSSPMLSNLEDGKVLVVFIEDGTYYHCIGVLSSGTLSFGSPSELPSGWRSSLVLSSTRVITCGPQKCQVGVVSGNSISYVFPAVSHWAFENTIVMSEFRFVSTVVSKYVFCVSNVSNAGSIVTNCTFCPSKRSLSAFFGPRARVSPTKFMVINQLGFLVLVHILPDNQLAFGPLVDFGALESSMSVVVLNSSRIMIIETATGQSVFVAGSRIRPSTTLIGIASSSGNAGELVEVVMSGISQHHTGLIAGHQYLALPSGEVLPDFAEACSFVIASDGAPLSEWPVDFDVSLLPAPHQRWKPVPRAGTALSDTELLVTQCPSAIFEY